MANLIKILKKQIIPVLGLIIFLALFRIIPHPSNFTPLLAAGVFSGFYFRSFFLGSFIVILAMFFGDLYLGFHNTMIFTYVSVAVAVAIGMLIRNFKFKEIFLTGFASCVCFFIITNFGAWLTLEMYEKSFAGLLQSYVLAIPFFHNTLISTVIYLVILKLLYNLSLKKKIIKFSF